MNELSLEDQCLVHRYLYYCLFNPIISDIEYDMLEKKAKLQADEHHPIFKPGSDLERDYDDKIKTIAKSLI